MNKQDWTWLPHASHLIVSLDCRFHLATVVGGALVSTVGEYWPDRQVREIHARIHDPEWHAANSHRRGDDYDYAYMKHFGFEEIGAASTYETMVFIAEPGAKKCDVCPFVIESGHSYDFDAYSDGKSAYEGHLAMCEKWAGKTADEIKATDEDDA